MLCDPGSLQLIRSSVRSPAMGDRARPGDGVLGGSGMVDGRPVFCYAQDPSFAGGSLGAAHAETIVRVLELADRGRAPVVGFVSSGGARMQEGVAALGGYGRIFRRTVALSGRVPQISIVSGLSAGGGAYSPALTDWIVMTEQLEHVPDRPRRRARGARRGGGRRASWAAPACTRATASATSSPATTSIPRGWPASCSAICPATATPRRRSRRPGPPAGVTPAPASPREARRVYDVRAVIAALVDGGELLEVSAGWARNLVTALTRIDGRTGRRGRQPAPLPGRRARRRQLGEGRSLRRPLRRLRHPAAGAGRHPRASCPGTRQEAGRRDPPRRHARARLRRGDRAADDRDPAQGVRRRVHHHELQGPRRRLRVRLAGAPRSA